ncbi:MAG: hypothetical protein AAB543_03770 [Pseudomonadota bacterium]
MTPMSNFRFLVPALALVLLALAGCGAVPGFAQVEGATTVVTEKPLSDHFVSFFSGKNCSTIRREKGQAYCEEDEMRSGAPKVYCYRSIGGVNCYDRPDPFDGQSYKTLEETPSPPKPPVR